MTFGFPAIAVLTWDCCESAFCPFGARRSDILQQFLTEAVLVCFVGGFLGVAMAFGLGGLVSLLTDKFAFIYSTPSIGGAFVVSTLIGILFGFLPARNASRLDPVVALKKG